MLLNITLDEAINLIKPNINYSLSNIEKDKDIYLNYNALCNKFPNIMQDLGKKLLKRRIETGDIQYRLTDNNIIEYSLYSIQKYNYDLAIFKESFIDVKTAIIEMGYSKQIFKANPQNRLNILDEKNLIILIKLHAPINHRQTFFVSKSDLNNFLNTYISFTDAANSLNVSLKTLKQYWLPKYTDEQINLITTEPNLCYVNKKNWLKFAKEKNKSNIISANQFAKKLKVSNTTFNLIVDEYKLKGEKFEFNIKSSTYYKDSDLEFLLNEQDKLLSYFSENFYTTKETLNIFGLTQNNLHRELYTSQIETIKVPPLMYIDTERFEFRRSNNKNLYNKVDVNKLKEKRDFAQQFDYILLHSQETPMNIFMTLCTYLNFEFDLHCNETKKLWFNYINQKFNSSHAVESTIRNYIRTCLNSTEILLKTIGEKEIYNCTTAHLKLNIFTEKYTKEARYELSRFLSKVYDSRVANGLEIYYKKEFPSYYNGIRNVDKETYTLEDYKKYFDYLNSKDLHLSKAIKSAIAQINGDYSDRYDSTWLYCLLHLNNAWRHYDVTTFPVVDLSGLTVSKFPPIEALEKIKNVGLSNEDINLIIFRCKSLRLKHSKTNKKRHFFCSKDLSNTLAHAIVICILRNSIVTPLSNMIIETDNKKRNIKDKFLNTLFQGDALLPKFKSKQFNRTVISLIYSIIKKQTNGNPLDIVKVVRSHIDIETTNIYTNIPQEDIDFITTQLFDLGNYGHIYDTLTKLLMNPEEYKNNQQDKAVTKIIKHLFGDVYHIESTIQLIREISQERESVISMLTEQSYEKNQQLKLTLSLGQLPAKQKDYQCILKQCKFPDFDCNMCPFAVFNFYNINQLCEEFIVFLEEYLNKFHKIEYTAEKTRLANRLYFYLMLLQEFKNSFGEETLNLFLPFKFNDLKQILKEIPSAKEFTTLSFKKRG
ncbi:hypothetical protein MHI04_15315 [Lysinibacillus sp. FSL K6-1151]|uniref:hypothetical protein n=1 Tax=Lysinibacillus sp. FSL K6-1151 TaxID=2921465 RepID=UPI003159FF16